MRTHVKKWGNSLAVRIPRSFAEEAGLEPDAAVDMTLVDGSLVVRSVSDGSARLTEMLARITDDNVHEGVDEGPSVGAEAW